MASLSPLLLEANLRRQILSNDLKEGERIKPLRKLAREYGVSYVTASRHIRKLCDEGYLDRRHGSGVFVRSRSQFRVALVPGLMVSDAFASLLHLFKETAPSRSMAEVVIEEVPYKGTGPLAADLDRFDAIFLSDYLVTQGFSLDQAPPIDDLVEFEDGEREDYYPALLEFFSTGGRLKMLPLVVSPMVLFVNRAMMEGAGLMDRLAQARSLDDLAAIHEQAAALRAKGTRGVALGLNYKRFALMARALRSKAVETAAPSLGDDKTRAVIRAIKSLYGRMGFAHAPGHSGIEREMFARGETWGVVEIATLLREIRQKAGFAPDILPVPVPETELWCSGIAITLSGMRKPGVRELLRFFKSRHALEIIGREKDFVPARQSVVEKLCAGAPPEERRAMEALHRAVQTGFLAGPKALAFEEVCRTARDVWDLL